MQRLILIWTLLALTPPAFADPLKIGDIAPKFQPLPSANSTDINLADHSNDVIAIVFICNHCSMSNSYEARLISLSKKYRDCKVTLVAINVNTNDADGLPRMKDRAKAEGYNFPYLYDATQQIARDLGANATPECLVFNHKKQLIYRGAIDDANDAKQVKRAYLDEAIRAALDDRLPEIQTSKPRGCGIKYDR